MWKKLIHVPKTLTSYNNSFMQCHHWLLSKNKHYSLNLKPGMITYQNEKNVPNFKAVVNKPK